MLKEYVESIPKQVFDILDNASVPTTIVYPKAKQLAPMAMADDGSIAIRIPKSGFALDLVKSFGKPIIATSANLSGEQIPEESSQISSRILEQVDYVVPLRKEINSEQPSRVVKIDSKGEIQILRE